MSATSQVIRSYDDVVNIRNNIVHLRATSGSEFTSSSIQFLGTGNVLYVEDGAKIRNSELRFLGNESVIYIRKSRRLTKIIVEVYHESVFYLGQESSFTSEARFQPTERKHIIIGDDAMFSSSIAFRTADPHLVYSVSSHQRINPSASIWIGDHVWLGQDTLVLKGAKVGSGSILAARSLVTKNVPSNSVAAGAPARITGGDIFWKRPSVHGYTEEQTEASSSHEGNEFVYTPAPEHARDHDQLEDQLDAAESGVERAAWCEHLDRITDKNRFYIPPAS